jgi:hypothetical protein
MWTENMKSSKYRLGVIMDICNAAYGMYEYGVVDGVDGSSENTKRFNLLKRHIDQFVVYKSASAMT